MEINVVVSREEAKVELKNNTLTLTGVLISEFLCPGRVTTPAPKRELNLIPGTIYRIYTGCNIVKPAIQAGDIKVEATPEFFAKGMEVKRIGIYKGELVVYVTVLEQVAFAPGKFMFTGWLLCQTLHDMLLSNVKDAAIPAGVPVVAAKTIKENVIPQLQAEVKKSDEQRAEEWLAKDSGPSGTTRLAPHPTPKAFTGKAEIRRAK
jgi:hypothetical protein